MRRRQDKGEEDVPIPEFLSIDLLGDVRLHHECTQNANFAVCKSYIGRYANARNMCAPSFSNPFPPSTPKMIGNAPDICISWIFPLIVSRPLYRGFLHPGWDTDSYVHDGSKPLIRISHWIEPVLGLTDCLECSQDRSFRLPNVFLTVRLLADVFVNRLF